MIDWVQVGTAAGIVVVLILATVIKSVRGGRLGSMLDNIRSEQRSDKVDDALAEIRDIAAEGRDQSRENGEKIDELAETVVLLHRDDDHVNVRELRQKVGVDDMDHDIFTDQRAGKSTPDD